LQTGSFVREHCNKGAEFLVCRDEMSGLFRVAGMLGQSRVLWFVNRNEGRGGYELDELFTSEEAFRFDSFLRSRDMECRVEEVCAPLRAEQMVSWNLAGRIVELDPAETAGLPFRVVGCLVFRGGDPNT
jgi:hypothetical protein